MKKAAAARVRVKLLLRHGSAHSWETIYGVNVVQSVARAFSELAAGSVGEFARLREPPARLRQLDAKRSLDSPHICRGYPA